MIYNLLPIFFQYYRQARVKALQLNYPDYNPEDINEMKSKGFRYPRPLSEPSSPSMSRHTTPTPSERNSDNEGGDEEDDDINDENELEELQLPNLRLED